MDTDDLYSATNLDSQLEHYTDSPHVIASTTDNALQNGNDNSDAMDDESASDSDDLVEDDLSILQRAWINERGAPELLEYEGAALENLMELVESGEVLGQIVFAY
ncbi:hypothetical protein FB645_004664 [Coemansia sp. IMI 203386]|nr:hypothetical protein FB645_004664 [Coemansia sp. IMI 203386]